MIDSELLRVFVLSPAELDPWDYHRSVYGTSAGSKTVWCMFSLQPSLVLLVAARAARGQKFASSLFPSNKPELLRSTPSKM